MKNLLVAVICILPSSQLKNRLLSLFRSIDVSPYATIRPCFVWGVDSLQVGADANVGLGNVLQSMRLVRLGYGASIGRANWVSASRLLISYSESPSAGELYVDDYGVITGRHHIDCSGGVFIGKQSTVAGHGTSFISHQIDISTSTQITRPISVGRDCFIGAACVITAGASISDRVVVGAGSVVISGLDRTESLYAGVPAMWKRAIEPTAKYFTRTGRYVWPAGHPEAQEASR